MESWVERSRAITYGIIWGSGWIGARERRPRSIDLDGLRKNERAERVGGGGGSVTERTTRAICLISCAAVNCQEERDVASQITAA